jgi:hypothetical protein
MPPNWTSSRGNEAKLRRLAINRLGSVPNLQEIHNSDLETTSANPPISRLKEPQNAQFYASEISTNTTSQLTTYSITSLLHSFSGAFDVIGIAAEKLALRRDYKALVKCLDDLDHGGWTRFVEKLDKIEVVDRLIATSK